MSYCMNNIDKSLGYFLFKLLGLVTVFGS
ncbi:hypothetical protein PANT111_170223 [Pantoea brenneri]|uniref:Uncharacterized protein n=1 Tax=Pantoea brenneri TaxID=472694 RepID=A0AAX3J4U7_9GAMM|nr:hypothetical protein PANT111_170223 [Pantoea brenneri]